MSFPTRPLLLLALAAGCAGSSSSTDNTDSTDDGQESCQAFDDTITDATVAYEEVGTNNWEVRKVDTASCPALVPSAGPCPYNGQVKDFQDDEYKPVLAGTTVKI